MNKFRSKFKFRYKFKSKIKGLRIIQAYNHTTITRIGTGIILIFPLLFLSCSDKNIDRNKFINAYIDLRIAQDTLNQDSTNIQKLKAEIFKRHGLTEKQYDETFNYYNEDPERWNAFYDSVIVRVDTLMKGKK